MAASYQNFYMYLADWEQRAKVVAALTLKKQGIPAGVTLLLKVEAYEHGMFVTYTLTGDLSKYQEEAWLGDAVFVDPADAASVEEDECLEADQWLNPTSGLLEAM